MCRPSRMRTNSRARSSIPRIWTPPEPSATTMWWWWEAAHPRQLGRAADRGGAASHHHHIVVAEGSGGVQIRGMDDLALEFVRILEGRHIRLVREVAVAVDQELGGEGPPASVNCPAFCLGAEHRLGDAGIEADVFQDREFFCDGAQVAADRCAALQALRGQEGLEAEGVLDEIGVAPRAVPSMGVPDSAQIVLALEYRVGNIIGAQVVARADAGDPGADDDDFAVDARFRHGLSLSDSPAWTEQAEAHGAKHGGRRCMNVELAVGILDVAADRVPGDADAHGYLRVTAAERQQAQHVQLARGEDRPRHAGRLRSRGRPLASHGTKVTSSTPMASTPTTGSAARHTSGSGLPKR